MLFIVLGRMALGLGTGDANRLSRRCEPSGRRTSKPNDLNAIGPDKFELLRRGISCCSIESRERRSNSLKSPSISSAARGDVAHEFDSVVRTVVEPSFDLE